MSSLQAFRETDHAVERRGGGSGIEENIEGAGLNRRQKEIMPSTSGGVSHRASAGTRHPPGVLRIVEIERPVRCARIEESARGQADQAAVRERAVDSASFNERNLHGDVRLSVPGEISDCRYAGMRLAASRSKQS